MLLEYPCALGPVSHKFPQCCFWNGSTVVNLIEDCPFLISSFQRSLLSTSFLCISPPDDQWCDDVLGCVPAGSVSSSSTLLIFWDASYFWWLHCLPVCSVIFLNSSMSRTVHPQESSKLAVKHCHVLVWASRTFVHLCASVFSPPGVFVPPKRKRDVNSWRSDRLMPQYFVQVDARVLKYRFWSTGYHIGADDMAVGIKAYCGLILQFWHLRGPVLT